MKKEKNNVDGSKFLRRVMMNMFITPIIMIALLCVTLGSFSIAYFNFSEKLIIIIGLLSFVILSGLWILNCIPQYSAYKKAFKKK